MARGIVPFRRQIVRDNPRRRESFDDGRVFGGRRAGNDGRRGGSSRDGRRRRRAGPKRPVDYERPAVDGKNARQLNAVFLKRFSREGEQRQTNGCKERKEDIRRADFGHGTEP